MYYTYKNISQKDSQRRRRAVARPEDSQETQTFEQELRDCVDLSPAPAATSIAPSATNAAEELSDDDFDARFQNTFEGIN